MDKPSHPEHHLCGLIGSRAQRLADGYVGGNPSSRAQLAELRRHLSAEPGSAPSIWSLTIEGVSPQAYGDDPTTYEVAAHTALTLFAVHQQSRSRSMHRQGVGLGEAIARLMLLERAGEAAVRRRFDAAATSVDLAELSHHLRGIVGQLRGHEVPLDYGMLAVDFARYQYPESVSSVRRKWGRGLYRQWPDAEASLTQEDNETRQTEEIS